MSVLLESAAVNLLTPVVLFFVLGAAAGAVRSDLKIPDALAKGLALYLMLAIGFKGGAAMSSNGVDGAVAGALAAGLVLSFALPFAAFWLLQMLARVDRMTAASIAAHYGSISVVTFVTATSFLDTQDIYWERYFVAVMAIMETPAIISGIWLARRGASAADGMRGPMISGDLVREVLLNGSVVLLLGAFAIGWVTGDRGLVLVSPFVVDLFPGLLCLFLLDMGLIAARQARGLKGVGPGFYAFGLIMPVVGASCGLLAALVLGLGVGGTTVLAVLAGSASYIAVPAAMRIALPKANPATSITLSLAITFPFNVTIGIPIYFAAATWLNAGVQP